MNTKKTKFSGILGKPRKYSQFAQTPLPPGANERKFSLDNMPESLIKIVHDQEVETDMEMLHLLLQHYNIDDDHENKWFHLCYRLSRDFVPGFSYEKASRGAPTKWTKASLKSLRTAVDLFLQEHPGYSAKSACRFWANKGIFPNSNTDTVYNKYLEAKRKPL